MSSPVVSAVETAPLVMALFRESNRVWTKTLAVTVNCTSTLWLADPNNALDWVSLDGEGGLGV